VWVAGMVFTHATFIMVSHREKPHASSLYWRAVGREKS